MSKSSLKMLLCATASLICVCQVNVVMMCFDNFLAAVVQAYMLLDFVRTCSYIPQLDVLQQKIG